MLRAVQPGHALDGQEVRADAADACSHAVEHVAQLLQIGLTGGVVDGGGALGQHGSHDDVGRTGDRGLVEQHVAALQLAGGNLVDIPLVDVLEACSEVFESQEVGVQAAPSYLVAPRLGDHGLAEARQQRTDEQHAAPQGGTLAHKLVALQVVQVGLVGLEHILAVTEPGHFHANIPDQLYEIVHVANVGDIADANLLAGKQGGTDYLQGLVFGSLRNDGAAQRVSAFYDKCCHNAVRWDEPWNGCLMLPG